MRQTLLKQAHPSAVGARSRAAHHVGGHSHRRPPGAARDDGGVVDVGEALAQGHRTRDIRVRHGVGADVRRLVAHVGALRDRGKGGEF
jgi:hypothetical protein